MVALICCQFTFQVAQYQDGGDSNDRVRGVGKVLDNLFTFHIHVVGNIAGYLEAVTENG